jgi:hypothetical protein
MAIKIPHLPLYVTPSKIYPNWIFWFENLATLLQTRQNCLEFFSLFREKIRIFLNTQLASSHKKVSVPHFSLSFCFCFPLFLFLCFSLFHSFSLSIFLSLCVCVFLSYFHSSSTSSSSLSLSLSLSVSFSVSLFFLSIVLFLYLFLSFSLYLSISLFASICIPFFLFLCLFLYPFSADKNVHSSCRPQMRACQTLHAHDSRHFFFWPLFCERVQQSFGENLKRKKVSAKKFWK